MEALIETYLEFASHTPIKSAKATQDGKELFNRSASSVFFNMNPDGNRYRLEILDSNSLLIARPVEFPTHWLDEVTKSGDTVSISWSGGDAGDIQKWKLELALDGR